VLYETPKEMDKKPSAAAQPIAAKAVEEAAAARANGQNDSTQWEPYVILYVPIERIIPEMNTHSIGVVSLNTTEEDDDDKMDKKPAAKKTQQVVIVAAKTAMQNDSTERDRIKSTKTTTTTTDPFVKRHKK
jgi:hypothetical protein